MENFKWDWIGKNSDSDWYEPIIIKEIFNGKIYEKIFTVEKDDIVLDIGASLGPFTYTILPNNPKLVICVEPSISFFYTLVENTQHGNVICLNKLISNIDGKKQSDDVYNNKNEFSEYYSITFQTLIKLFNLDHIDFIKTDCEGGEYDIFNSENLLWIKQNVKKIAGEWHLSNENLKQKFRVFRDTFLKEFINFNIFSVDGVDIKWDLWNEHFIDYYNEIIIYIDNR